MPNFHKKAVLFFIAVMVLCCFPVSAVQAEKDQKSSDPKSVEDLDGRLQLIHEIYENERQKLKDELQFRLQEIEWKGGAQRQRAQAIEKYKQDQQALKEAFEQALSEHQEKIGVSNGKDPEVSEDIEIIHMNRPALKAGPESVNININTGRTDKKTCPLKRRKRCSKR